MPPRTMAPGTAIDTMCPRADKDTSTSLAPSLRENADAGITSIERRITVAEP